MSVFLNGLIIYRLARGAAGTDVHIDVHYSVRFARPRLNRRAAHVHRGGNGGGVAVTLARDADAGKRNAGSGLKSRSRRPCLV